jgi:hypothetical protein
MPRPKKVKEVVSQVVSQFDDPAFEVKQEVECKHQNQGEGKCFDCGISVVCDQLTN